MNNLGSFRRKGINVNKYILLKTLTGLVILGNITHVQAQEQHVEINFRNAYIDRNFTDADIENTGSWSQSVSAFYRSSYTNTPIGVGVDLSTQYALRLSQDKHTSDSVLPFDANKQEQERHFLKYGATLKAKYENHELRVGELWNNLPIIAVDPSRQLLSSHLGALYQGQWTSDLKVEVGHIAEVSPRNEEDFRKIAIKNASGLHESDGLNYVDLNYQISPTIKAQYFYGDVTDLFDQHYFGLNYKWLTALDFQTDVKGFISKDSGDSKAGKIDNQNYAILNKLNYGNHSFALGYQQLEGDTAFPIPEGFMPQVYFINWNLTGFYKKDEKSWHAMYGYNFKDYVPGLNGLIKYANGYDFMGTSERNGRENETNYVLNYKVQNPVWAGLGFQWVFIDYRSKYGNDMQENRIFTTYSMKF